MCEGTFPSAWNLAASITENIGETAAWCVLGTDNPLNNPNISSTTISRCAASFYQLLDEAG
jgi:hypothetical protein